MCLPELTHVSVLQIGASTETEQKEKRLRYEDSINAVRAALETGYVPGGGVTYLALSTDEFFKKIADDIEATARNEMVCDGEEPVGAAAEVVGKRHRLGNGLGYCASSYSTFTPVHLFPPAFPADEMEGEIELQKAGARIVVDSMKSITKQIADNAGRWQCLQGCCFTL